MKYIIHSTLILGLLMIGVNVIAQDSLHLLGERYGLIITDTTLKSNAGTWDLAGNYNPSLYPDNRVEITKNYKYFSAVVTCHHLKENGLVVVLRTRSNQLDKLELLSRDNSLTIRQQENIKARITAIKQENNLLNEALLMSFSNDYRFSDYYFIYDSSLTQLKEGVTKGIFLNNDGLVDNTIDLLTTDFYICNYTLVSASNQAEGLVIYNSKMKRVEEPFPGVAVSGSSGLNMLLQLLTGNDEHYNKKIRKDVEKLQRNLNIMMEKGDRKFKKSGDE